MVLKEKPRDFLIFHNGEQVQPLAADRARFENFKGK